MYTITEIYLTALAVMAGKGRYFKFEAQPIAVAEVDIEHSVRLYQRKPSS